MLEKAIEKGKVEAKKRESEKDKQRIETLKERAEIARAKLKGQDKELIQAITGLVDVVNGRELAEEVAKILKQRGEYNRCVNQLNKLNASMT